MYGSMMICVSFPSVVLSSETALAAGSTASEIVTGIWGKDNVSESHVGARFLGVDLDNAS